MNKFSAKFKYAGRFEDTGAKYYTLFIEGYNYCIGSMKKTVEGKWVTYCGGRRDIAFHYLNSPEFDTAANALANFRAHYEAAEAKAATIRANAFSAIAGRVPEIVVLNNLSETELDDLRIVVNLVYCDGDAYNSIEFECTPAEALAFMECDETNTNVVGRTYTKRNSTERDFGFAKWVIPGYSKNYHIEGICRSVNDYTKVNKTVMA